MKKTFNLTDGKRHQDRVIEAIKHDIRKYIKRERKKPLIEGADYLDFDCKFGVDELDSENIHLAEIDKSIELAVEKKLDKFYLEIIAKPGYRNKSI